MNFNTFIHNKGSIHMGKHLSSCFSINSKSWRSFVFQAQCSIQVLKKFSIFFLSLEKATKPWIKPLIFCQSTQFHGQNKTLILFLRKYKFRKDQSWLKTLVSSDVKCRKNITRLIFNLKVKKTKVFPQLNTSFQNIIMIRTISMKSIRFWKAILSKWIISKNILQCHIISFLLFSKSWSKRIVKNLLLTLET